MIKKILIRLIIIALVAAGASTYYFNVVRQPESKLYYGEAEPVTSDVYTKVPGVIEAVMVEEGRMLAEGDTLMVLESEEARLNADKARLAVSAAETNKDKSQQPARDQELSIQENNILQLEGQKEVVLASISNLRKLYSQSQLNVASLEATYSLHTQTYKDLLALYESGMETKFNLDNAELAMTNSGNAYEGAKLDGQRTLNEITGLELQLTNLDVQINSAKEQLDLMKSGYGDEDRQLTEINEDLASVDVALAELVIENHTITSYSDGIVESVNFDAGEFVSVGAKVITLYDPNALTVSLYISEKDLPLIHVGDVLQMSLVAVEDVTVEGIVTQIATEAMFTPVNIVMAEDRERLVYRIEVAIEGNDQVRPGMLLSTDFTELE